MFIKIKIKSQKKLALKVNAKEIRFWGKILARNKDYYVKILEFIYFFLN